MSQIPPEAAAELVKALRDCYIRMPQLDEFLRTKLDRRVDDLTSRYIPLTDSIAEVVQKAQTQGWATDLVREAAEDRPQNMVLATLFTQLPAVSVKFAVSPRRSQNDRPSLLCGRGDQWSEVCQCAPTRLHQVILVPGGRGQEPLHFRDRIQTWLTPDPSRTMLIVHWQTPPVALGEMIEALCVAFSASADTLSQAVGRKLAHQNLILLHPCLLKGFSQEHIIKYYTELIPSLLAPLQVEGRLKCVQPIEWPLTPPSGIVSRLFAGGDEARETRETALKMLATLQAKQPANIRILDVDELQNLQQKELERFLENSEFPVEHQSLLLEQLLTGPQVPGFMFKTIDDYWRGLPGNS